jgi:hypothetical protein
VRYPSKRIFLNPAARNTPQADLRRLLRLAFDKLLLQGQTPTPSRACQAIPQLYQLLARHCENVGSREVVKGLFPVALIDLRGFAAQPVHVD